MSVNTAGKALGVSGAFVAGPAWAIEYLIQRARPFIFSTAPPPALAAALEASLDIVADEPERRARLRQLRRDLRARLRAAGVAVPPGDSHIIPVVIGDNDRALAVAAGSCRREGFDVRAIRPPSVAARHGAPADFGERRPDRTTIIDRFAGVAGVRAAGSRSVLRGSS